MENVQSIKIEWVDLDGVKHSFSIENSKTDNHFDFLVDALKDFIRSLGFGKWVSIKNMY